MVRVDEIFVSLYAYYSVDMNAGNGSREMRALQFYYFREFILKSYQRAESTIVTDELLPNRILISVLFNFEYTIFNTFLFLCLLSVRFLLHKLMFQSKI